MPKPSLCWRLSSHTLRGLWPLLERMSLEQRLLVSLATLLLVLFLGLGALQLRQAQEELTTFVQDSQDRSTLFLSHLLSDWAVLRDYTTIEQLLRRRVAQGDLNQAGFSLGPVLIQVPGPDNPPQAPRWFHALLGLHAVASQADIRIGGQYYGTVSTTFATEPWVGRLWQELKQQLLGLWLGLFILWWLVRCLVQGNLQGLRILDNAVDLFAKTGGWTSIRLEPGSAPEMVANAASLNQMGQRVGELLAHLAEEEERWRVTLAAIEDGVVITDLNGDIVYANPAALRLSLWHGPTHGIPVETLLQLEMPEHPARTALRLATQHALPQGWLVQTDGKRVAVRGTAAPVRDAIGTLIGAVVVLHDETERYRLVQELHTLAFQDPLTGLPNRRGVESRLECAVRDAQTQGRQHVFCYIDLDQFKLVNDLCGHPAGDRLLREIAQLMRAAVPAEYCLGRLGGDEFGLILFDTSLEAAQALGQAILEQFQAFRYRHEDQHVFKIGASLGMTVIQPDTLGVTEVMAQADKACYLAKSEGRNRVQIYQTQTRLTQMEYEMHGVSSLLQALDEGRLLLFRQAVAAVSTPQQFDHYEILIRLRTPAGELQSPAHFLPAAEHYGLAPTIDRYVVRTLLDYLAKHPEAKTSYAVNLSGRTLAEPDFLNFVAEQLAFHQISANRLCFEITETAAINDLQSARRMVEGLRELGCRFFLDDFGSGMCSFAYLKQLPVDYLKIDGSFIRNMLTDSDDLVIVNAVAQIARDLRRQTVAEFVESDLLLERLRSIGVDYAQGYAIHVPEPLPR